MNENGFSLYRLKLKGLERRKPIKEKIVRKSESDFLGNGEIKMELSSLQSAFEKTVDACHNVVKASYPYLMEALGDGLGAGLYVLGGTSGSGKTTFATNLALRTAELGTPVLVYSLEMTTGNLVSKMLSRTAFLRSEFQIRKSMTDIQRKHFTEDEWQAFKDCTAEVWKLPIDIEDSTTLGCPSVDAIRDDCKEKIRKCREQGSTPLVIIDYLQYVALGQTAEQRTAIDYAVKVFKTISAQEQVPVWVLSSVNRNAYGKDPSMSDFKESGGIEFTADVCMILNTEGDGKAIPHRNSAFRDVTLHILKNRFGMSGTEIGYYYFPKENEYEEVSIR